MLSPASDSSELSNWWPATLHGDGFGGSLGAGGGAGAGLGVELGTEPGHAAAASAGCRPAELAVVFTGVCLAGSAGGTLAG